MVSQPVISKFFKKVKSKDDLKRETKPKEQEVIILSDDEVTTSRTNASAQNDISLKKEVSKGSKLIDYMEPLSSSRNDDNGEESDELASNKNSNLLGRFQHTSSPSGMKVDTNISFKSSDNIGEDATDVISVIVSETKPEDEQDDKQDDKLEDEEQTPAVNGTNDCTDDNLMSSENVLGNEPNVNMEDTSKVKSQKNADDKTDAHLNNKPEEYLKTSLKQSETEEKNMISQTNSVTKSIKSSFETIKRSNEDNSAISKPLKRAKKSSLTPLDEQIKDLKLENPDKLLVVRVGYKYKCFASDAIVASSILQIKLVPGKLSFDGSKPQDTEYKQFAYCSFPDIRLNIHLDRLIQHNLKIGIVEQIETVALKKNSTNRSNSVFQRKITKVLSLATYGINIDKVLKFNGNEILGDTKSIWILQLLSKSTNSLNLEYSLISVNLNSGEVIYDEFQDTFSSTEQLFTRSEHLQPIEVILRDELSQDRKDDITSKISTFLKQNNCKIIPFNETAGSKLTEEVELFEFLKDLKVSKEIKSLVPILFNYLKEYRNENILTLAKNYKPFQSKLYMLLDGKVLSSLDIFSNDDRKVSLFWILDHTRTPYGARQLRSWIMRPLLNSDEIEKRLNAIECVSNVVHNIFFDALNNLLKSSPDYLHILNRITYGSTSRKEVYFFLKQLNELINHFRLHERYLNQTITKFDDANENESSLLKDWLLEIFDYLKDNKLPRYLTMINVSGALDKDPEKQVIEFFNLNNFDQANGIIQIQKDIENIRQELNSELVNIRRILKRPHLNFKNEIEYLIEVRNTQVKGLPQDWIKVNDTKLLSRFLTPVCSKLVEKLQYHKDLLKNECELQYNNFLNYIKNEYSSIKTVAQNLANYDCILSLSATACNVNYVRPKFSATQGQFIKVKDGRNPIIESLDINYVPNDITMSMNDGSINIITGPNMGGKSSYMRQVALLIIMAQIGSFVPAQSMECSVFDNIFTRIGAYDDLIHGQSTFKVEMTELLYILNKCTDRSLLLLDEIGRGTGTIDGKSISYSVLKYFLEMDKCPLVLFTTHFLMLTEQLRDPSNNRLKSYYMDYIEEKKPGEDWNSVSFLYKLKAGCSKDSFGLNVAKLAHISKDIINSAHSISKDMKQDEEINEKLLRFSCQLKSIFKKSNSAKTKLNLLLELSEEAENF